MHAPGGVQAHPRAEHFIPFVFAAAALVGQGLRLHQRIAFGTMSLAAFGFGGIVKDVVKELDGLALEANPVYMHYVSTNTRSTNARKCVWMSNQLFLPGNHLLY